MKRVMLFAMLSLASCGSEKPETCDDGNRLASVIVSTCQADTSEAICLFQSGAVRYAGCDLNVGTEASPLVVSCVERCR